MSNKLTWPYISILLVTRSSSPVRLAERNDVRKAPLTKICTDNVVSAGGASEENMERLRRLFAKMPQNWQCGIHYFEIFRKYANSLF